MQPFEILLPLALILCLTKFLGLGAQKIGLPAVIGMLVAGVLVGFLQYVPADGFHSIFFSADIKEWLSVFAKIGVVLIMFATGLGTDLKQLKAAGKPSIVITSFGVVVPMVLGALVAWAFLPEASLLSPDNKLLTYLFYGAILTATSDTDTVAT